MAADCKSAAPCELRRFESSPVHQLIQKHRLFLALAAYVVIAALAWTTLPDTRIRLVTLAILAMFAFRTWVRRKEVMHSGDEPEDDR
jgi:hypothetical protein